MRETDGSDEKMRLIWRQTWRNLLACTERKITDHQFRRGRLKRCKVKKTMEEIPFKNFDKYAGYYVSM